MEEFVIEIRFKADTDYTSAQIERKVLAAMRAKLDWTEADIDCEVMGRSEAK